MGGFARENEVGIPLESSVRNYKDASHKPELVVALSRFHALAGFRDPQRTVKLLEAIAVPELQPYVGLIAGQPDSDGLRALFTTWITLPQPVLGALMPRVLDGCVDYLSNTKDGEFAAEVRTALELSEVYPGDAGVLAALLLNRVTLEPGQGLYLDAGNLHAYLHGMAVEIMANSDNVLRGGLTPKHVDVPELLRVLDFDTVDIPILEARERPGRGRIRVFDAGAGIRPRADRSVTGRPGGAPARLGWAAHSVVHLGFGGAAVWIRRPRTLPGKRRLDRGRGPRSGGDGGHRVCPVVQCEGRLPDRA